MHLDKGRINLRGIVMSWKSNEEKCSYCEKTFKIIIEALPSKMDVRRESYYCCPYCEKVAGTIILQGNEEVTCKKI